MGTDEARTALDGVRAGLKFSQKFKFEVGSGSELPDSEMANLDNVERQVAAITNEDLFPALNAHEWARHRTGSGSRNKTLHASEADSAGSAQHPQSG